MSYSDENPVFDMVLFGGTGDLVMRKLLPALFQAHVSGQLHAGGRFWAVGRRDLGRSGYLRKVEEAARPHTNGKAGEAAWQAFCERIDYLQLDAEDPAAFQQLAQTLAAQNERGVAIFYLSTAPSYFIPICRNLAAAGLNGAHSRVVLEKPLGTDLASSNAINEAVAECFAEEQVYRIDHYLGKEAVQNLLALRFANVLFEPLWQRQWIDSVQITIAESLGVEGRGEFYEGTGALRDMVQNHLLQLLCMVAMEPPASLDADAVRNEKLKVLKSLKPLTEADVAQQVVYGQYREGAIRGQAVPSYRDEANVAPDSRTETFVAIKAEIDNWRWAGVPFFLRTGKRMQEKLAEIVVQFRNVPLQLFPGSAAPNRLVIRLQPDEDIRLFMQAKQPGNAMAVTSTVLSLDVCNIDNGRHADAYQRLLLDVIHGKLALFMRRDELVAAWEWVTPIMDYHARHHIEPKPYMAGSWGPAAASALLSKNQSAWYEEL